jgi:SAM-dependent methyltransferase
MSASGGYSTPDHFDAMFDGDDDPWRFRTRWYEKRKRALTLACLPQASFGSVFEPGCANGELTAALASRCTRLLATDGSARAVTLARAQTAALAHVEVRQAWLPDEWPDESFDLIVISELAYFLSSQALDDLIDHTRRSTRTGGTVLACHWRPPIEGCALDGDTVHRRFSLHLDMPHLMAMSDADMRIDVWCRDPRSVGRREGLS